MASKSIAEEILDKQIAKQENAVIQLRTRKEALEWDAELARVRWEENAHHLNGLKEMRRAVVEAKKQRGSKQ